MDTSTGLYAVVPAIASNSPDENKLLGLYEGAPLFFHSLLLGNDCSEVIKTFLITNSLKIEQQAKNAPNVVIKKISDFSLWARKPLAQLELWVRELEESEGEKFRFVLNLNPFYSHRETENIMECFQRMVINGLADGIQSVSARSKMDKGLLTTDDEGFIVPVRKENVTSAPVYVASENLVLWRRSSIEDINSSPREALIFPYEMSEKSSLPV